MSLTSLDEPIDVVAVVISAQKRHVNRKPQWTVKARVIRILSESPKLSVESESWLSILKFTGTVVNLTYSGPILKNVSIRPGILFRCSLPQREVEQALEQIAQDETPELHVRPEVIRPMAEPCVRVPLSILRELRGQEAGIEYTRRALVQTWSEDRQTGKAVHNPAR